MSQPIRTRIGVLGVVLVCGFLAIVFQKMSGKPVSSIGPDLCRAHLKQMICVVTSPQNEKDRYRNDRVCESGADISLFLRQIESAYDSYPPFLRNQLCSLSKVYLEEDFFGNAWSDKGIIAINKKLSDADPNAGNALSGFAQLSFGGKKPGYEPSLALPRIKVDPSMVAVTHTLLHELGHTFDYDYGFQKRGWEELSNKDFPLRKKICLNNCKNDFLSISEMPELYKELDEQGYVSQLAAVSPMEDFAETFALVVEHDEMGRKLTVEIGEPVIDPLAGAAVGKKINYMRSVIDWLHRGAKGELSIFTQK
jgi:hypothetical protein